MSDPILSVVNLKKDFRSHWTFRRTHAVTDASFELYEGEIFGFLGHNGAGKTTTMKCILGLIRRSGGTVMYRGEPLERAEQRRTIGYLPELPYFYDYLTVRETVDFFGRLARASEGRSAAEFRSHVSATIDRVGLSHKSDVSVRSLSKGLQQRLGFAQAIIHNPKLLFLDEPFSGLDPLGRKEMRDLIMELRQKGTTIILSSHILSDVEHISDRVSIMAQGSVRTTFSIGEIPKLFGEIFELSLTENSPADLLAKISLRATESELSRFSGLACRTFRFRNYGDALQSLQDAVSLGVAVKEFRGMSLPLEEIFVTITKDARSSAAPGGPR